ncbi:TonB-dependent receptor [Prevotella sp.]|uniref:TonB-dependent receptor n=1 Tax=Prevotella sp. TaxID=59823 RepID=UPI002F939B4B
MIHFKQLPSIVLGLLMLGSASHLHAQQKLRLSGHVYENGKQPLIGATISVVDFKFGAVADADGRYQLTNVPQGKVRLLIKYLGKEDIDTVVNMSSNRQIDFFMKDENFRLNDVVVVAQTKTSGSTTASFINRNAIDHLQATSLADILALAPGAISGNQTLDKARMVTVRGVNDTQLNQFNSFGTAIYQDGAPLSNNANLSSLNPSLNGSAVAMAGGASANTGIDARGVSAENIESVELIRGIPSVEYGDLTSGAVILHTKAGREPLRISAKANPNVYQGSVGTGFELGRRAGALNISGDYAYSNKDLTASYASYQRINAKATYSNTFFNNRLRTNTSLGFSYAQDRMKQNPDLPRDVSRGTEAGLRLNTNGLIQFDNSWIKNIRYVVQGSYVSKQSMTEEEETAANSVYSGTTTDGTTLSNRPGQRVYDAEGKEITHFSDADVASGYYAHYLPNAYLSHNEIDSREVNLFAKLTANFFKNFGKLNNGLLLGIDFKADGNEGAGTKWSLDNPPARSVSNYDGSYRPRSYRAIPYIKTLGLFAEENIDITLGQRTLHLQGGLRYDHTSVVGGALAPRVNASFDLIPNVLSIRGGYGITAKLPSLFYLYPQQAYFEYVHLNELPLETIPENERLLLTTTRIVDTQNRELKIAKNYKSEIGFDLKLGKSSLSVTAFNEHLRDGYGLGSTVNTFLPFNYTLYKRNEANQIVANGTYPILSSYYTPVNHRDVRTRGLEFELNTGRIDAIRTAFQLSGAWMEARNSSRMLHFYDNSSSLPNKRTDIAIYDPKDQDDFYKQFVTTLRATHNIPRIGFVVTLTAQAVWNESEWTVYYNDQIPIGYLSLKDGKPYYFEAGKFQTVDDVKAAGYDYLLQNVNHRDAKKETVSPYFQFNLNLTKEIGDVARISFFANNFFRSYPIKKSNRYPGQFYKKNSDFYFGMELSLKL